jgi:hypothetical protein
VNASETTYRLKPAGPVAGRGNVSPEIEEAIERQRREVQQRLVIVGEYEKLVPPGRRSKRSPRVSRADRFMRRRFGVSVSTIRTWRRGLARLHQRYGKMLFGAGSVHFNDLPARCKRTARRRLVLIRGWRQVVEIAATHRRHIVGPMTGAYQAKHPGTSRSGLYTWARLYRMYGLTALIDRRQCILIRQTGSGHSGTGGQVKGWGNTKSE